MSQLTYPPTHAGLGTNPFCYTYEARNAFGVKRTASPVYDPVAITQDVNFTMNGQSIDVRQMGSHLTYEIRTAGVNFDFTIPVHPLDITFLNIGLKEPAYSTPAPSNTSADSYTFLIKYLQSEGTAEMLPHYLFALGARPNTTNISVTAQGLVEASMDWMCREVTVPITTTNGGLTTPDIPDFTDITGSVVADSDAGTLPFTYDGVTYPVSNFSIQANNNLIREAYNGSGLADVIMVGGIEYTGSFAVPVGKNLDIETAIHDVGQTGAPASYNFKSGTMELDMTGMLLQTNATNFEGSPTGSRKNTVTFKCSSVSLHT